MTIAARALAAACGLALAPVMLLPVHADDRPGGAPGRESLELWFLFPLPGPGPGAVIGIDLDPERSAGGARVRNVMPGSPAAGAGIRAGDVVVAVGGTRLAGYADPGAAIAEQMRGVRVGQRVSLEILRDGRAIGFEVVAQAGPSAAGAPSWLGAPGLVPGADGVPAAPAVPSAPAAPRAPGGAVLQPAIDGLAAGDPGTAVGPGPGDRLELADLSSQTQPRSGAQGGVLVVRAPRVPGWNLEDGDIIVAIDGRRPADVQHAARILRSYRGGETLQLTIVRRGQTRTLAVRLPEPRRVV